MQDTLRAISEMDSNDLDQVIKAVKDRHKVLLTIQASTTLSTVRVGDRVELTGLSPKYLNGCKAEVKAIGTEISIVLENGWFEQRAREKFAGRVIRVKPQCVKVIDAAAS